MTGTAQSIDQVVTLHGDKALMERAGHLFAPRREFICLAIDTATWSVRVAHAETPTPMVPEGVDVYKMYTPQAVADPAARQQLLAVRDAGAQVRICPTRLPYETIIIDGRVAIQAGASQHGVRAYTVVSVPTVVAGMRSLFFATWQSAADLTDVVRAGPPSVDDEGMAILRLLSSGQKDVTAARRLGMSVRTYRRRVAELMVVLDADSRFQAGARARALGLKI
ncbi:MAG TPA: DNA-binding response regulator [Pseudonocardiaceae bacterium]|nr:DNA-binding response regulator [Pseudonocardiaceae bacterium]